MIRPLRLSRAVIASAILLMPVAASITAPGAAHANTCNTVATGSWSNNCTVQEGADSNFVVAIQVTATLESPPCNTNIDGDFGDNTEAEVVCFQRASSLSTTNGTVNSETWGALQNELRWEGRIGDWSYWTNVAGCSDTSCSNFRKWVPTEIWYVGTLGWEQMNSDDTQ